MRSIRIGILLLALSLLFVGPARAADFPAPTATKPHALHPAIAVEERTYTQPRPLRVWVSKIDLTCPELELLVTPQAKVEPPLETRAETAFEFARNHRSLLTINTNAFGPSPVRSGMPVSVKGLVLSQGQWVSPPEAGHAGVVWDGLNRPTVTNSATRDDLPADALNGVAGFQPILVAGVNYRQPQPNTDLQPRTALGLTADRKTMYWFVVDGRQEGQSEGVTEWELGELAKAAGCDFLLNLDGGGSTTLVAWDTAKDQPRVLNTPVGMKLPGTLRPNGAHLGLRVWTRKNGVTLKQLLRIMPACQPERAQRFLAPLNQAMAEFGIDTPLRRAAFLALVAHETFELKHLEDPNGGKDDELRQEIGNTERGDGARYKGRGPLLIRGRANYVEAGRALNLDLELHPELAAQPEVGARLAGWYWQHKKLNLLADAKDLETLTRRLTHRFAGVGQRDQYYQRALAALTQE